MRAARRFLTLLLTGTVLAAACTPLAKNPWAGNHGGGGGRRPRANLGGDWPELRPVRDAQDMRLPPLKLKRRRRPDRPIVVLPRVPSYIGAALPPVPTVPSPYRPHPRQRSTPAYMP